MVERLKQAIEKARRERAGAEAAAPRPQPAPPAPGAIDLWGALPEIRLEDARLEANRIVAVGRANPNHVSFDILRTRLLKLCLDNGWRRIGVSSPRKGCGKTLVALNLAFSTARLPEARALLIDLDLRAPLISRRLGATGQRSVAAFLRGEVRAEDYLVRAGERLALGLNDRVESGGAEALQSAAAVAVLNDVMQAYAPTIAIFDLPPLLAGDDAMATLDMLDAVLLIAGGGQTQVGELSECQELLEDRTNFLGVVLNRADDADAEKYAYVADSA